MNTLEQHIDHRSEDKDMNFFEKKKGAYLFFWILIFFIIFSFKADFCESAAVTDETSMAGMTLYLDRYYSASIKKKAAEKKNKTQNKLTKKTPKKTGSNINDTLAKAGYKYKNLGVANISSSLNVHKKASESSRIVGKMTKNSGCDIKKVKGKWAYISSGKVKGYVLSKYLLKKDAARQRAKKVARLRAVVNTATLNVRTLPSIDSKICDTLSREEEYTVGNANIKKEWLEKYIKTHINKSFGKKQLKSVNKKAMYEDLNNWIMLSIDEEDVFINKDFLEFNYTLDKAVTYTEPKSTTSDTSHSGTSGHYSGKKSIYSRMVAYAMKFLGNRYVWGGTSLTNGTDCSGFTMRIYEHFGYSIPRVSRAQAAFTKSVNASDVRIGDLFFYGSNGYISHVAMYIGNGQIIHASNKRDGIKISNAYYRKPIKIGRVIK